MARTIVYIDGFNLYYRALKGTAHKWLDIAAMSAACLPTGYQIQAINYYTAHISGRLDPTAPARQKTYLRALETLPKVAIYYGNFLVTQKWSGSCSTTRLSASLHITRWSSTGSSPRVENGGERIRCQPRRSLGS